MVETGERVRVRYTGILDDETMFDSSALRGEPFCFVVGAKTMLPAFEQAVSEMEIGEVRTVRIPADKAYGAYDGSLIEAIPEQSVPDAEGLPVGGYIVVSTAAGSARVKVAKRENGFVYLDCNHELAGKDLTFCIELVAVERESAIERERHPAGCACGCDRLKRSLVSS